MQISSLFERAVCINLKRRVDRWESFNRDMDKANWPFGRVQRFGGIDGQLVPAPSWFDVGEASYTWGCLVSHLRIWESAINDGVESLLIFEDDAVLCEDFTHQATAFLQEVPDDWDAIFLGGHHVPGSMPSKVNNLVYRVDATWRLHCYAVRRHYLESIYREVCKFNADGGIASPADFHVDRQIANHMKGSGFSIYCPPKWLVGQRSDRSDIAQCYRHHETEFYNGFNPIPQ